MMNLRTTLRTGALAGGNAGAMIGCNELSTSTETPLHRRRAGGLGDGPTYRAAVPDADDTAAAHAGSLADVGERNVPERRATEIRSNLCARIRNATGCSTCRTRTAVGRRSVSGWGKLPFDRSSTRYHRARRSERCTPGAIVCTCRMVRTPRTRALTKSAKPLLFKMELTLFGAATAEPTAVGCPLWFGNRTVPAEENKSCLRHFSKVLQAYRRTRSQPK